MQYGFAVNDGRGKQLKRDNQVDAKGRNALGYYLNFGLKKEAGNFEYYLGMRWGKENSNFKVYLDKSLEYRHFRFGNNSFTFIFSPGVVLNRHNKLFLTLGLARVFKSSITGGGDFSYNSGNYTYQYGDNQVRDCWNFREGIKWQIRPSLNKKMAFELGLEVPVLYYKAILRVPNSNYFLPAAEYHLSYHLNLLYLGMVF